MLILPFAVARAGGGGLAFLVYARHAADGERISLQGRRLVVELENAGHLRAGASSTATGCASSRGAGDRSLIELSGQGAAVSVGRYVRPELRPALAQEIRRALRGA